VVAATPSWAVDHDDVNRPRLVAFGAALVAYGACLFVSRALLAGGSVTGSLGAAIALLPVPAGVALLVIAIREFVSHDELEQRIG
jgi:hypothetical protein